MTTQHLGLHPLELQLLKEAAEESGTTLQDIFEIKSTDEWLSVVNRVDLMDKYALKLAEVTTQLLSEAGYRLPTPKEMHEAIMESPIPMRPHDFLPACPLLGTYKKPRYCLFRAVAGCAACLKPDLEHIKETILAIASPHDAPHDSSHDIILISRVSGRCVSKTVWDSWDSQRKFFETSQLT